MIKIALNCNVIRMINSTAVVVLCKGPDLHLGSSVSAPGPQGQRLWVQIPSVRHSSTNHVTNRPRRLRPPQRAISDPGGGMGRAGINRVTAFTISHGW